MKDLIIAMISFFVGVLLTHMIIYATIEDKGSYYVPKTFKFLSKSVTLTGKP